MSNQPAVDSEIRDVLLETYAANDPMNKGVHQRQNLLQFLE